MSVTKNFLLPIYLGFTVILLCVFFPYLISELFPYFYLKHIFLLSFLINTSSFLNITEKSAFSMFFTEIYCPFRFSTYNTSFKVMRILSDIVAFILPVPSTFITAAFEAHLIVPVPDLKEVNFFNRTHVWCHTWVNDKFVIICVSSHKSFFKSCPFFIRLSFWFSFTKIL